MSSQEITNFLSVLADLSTALLALVVTIVALFPTLIELVRERQPNFLSVEIARRSLRGNLRQLSWTIWGFGMCTLLSMLGLAWANIYLAAITFGLFSLCLLLVIWSSFRIAKVYRSALDLPAFEKPK